jgi:hypothetical protein
LIFSDLQYFTETVQSTGPENIGPQRPLPGPLAPGPVNSHSRITLENNGKILPQPDWENAVVKENGGEEVRHTFIRQCSQPSEIPSKFEAVGYGVGFCRSLVYAPIR